MHVEALGVVCLCMQFAESALDMSSKQGLEHKLVADQGHRNIVIGFARGMVSMGL